MDINTVIVIGNLTKDADLKYFSSGSAVANVTIAINRNVRRGEQWEKEANFFDVKIFGKTAENLKPYLTKGKKIAVQGYLKQEKWQSEDGQKHSKVVINAEEVQLLGGNNQPTQPQDNNAEYAGYGDYGYGA